MSDGDARRIEELEVALAFQEQLIRELDAFVRGFHSRIERAERELAELKQSVAAGGVAFGPADDPPPHY